MKTKENGGGDNHFGGGANSLLTFADVLEASDPRHEPIINKCLFTFARGLAALATQHNGEFTVEELREMFAAWYERYENQLYDGGFEDNFFDLLEKYERVKVPLGSNAVEAAWQKALASPFPPEADLFQQVDLKRLTALCWHLQEATGDAPFYLSCRTVQSLMKLKSPEQAARRLRGLVRFNVLKEIEKGGPHTNKATRYRYKKMKKNDG